MNNPANHGISIYLNNNDRIDLKDILSVVGEKGYFSNWQISGVECFGESAELLHEFSDSKKQILGEEFYRLVSIISQVIDGTFEAFKLNEVKSWLVIRSIRGDEFDVETKDKEILDNIKASFKQVTDLVY